MAITSLHGVPEYERLEAIDDRGDDASYRDELLLEVQRRSTADPLYGYIQTNLGIMDLVDGNWEAALTRFWPVANGNVASAAAHRVMAMIRIAWILHHQGQRLRAYQAYREIEQFTGSDAVRARCQVECIGLMMELAESGRGTHAQMRTAAARVLSSISDDFVQPRATIELMVLESHARQASPDYDRALELGEAFLANCQDRMIDHPELAREVGSALHQMGRWQLEMGRLEQAREMYERCLREFPASAERFAGSHPHAQSMIGLAVIAADLGDRGTHDQILRDLFEIFPEDRSVQQFRQVQPRIERDYAPSPGVERGDWSSSETLTRELQ
jgi:tetratricopeptide (TPR) repeat protein